MSTKSDFLPHQFPSNVEICLLKKLTAAPIIDLHEVTVDVCKKPTSDVPSKLRLIGVPKQETNEKINPTQQAETRRNWKIPRLLEPWRELCKKAPGPHSFHTMRAAGFAYTNNGDAARCDRCGLEVSRWTEDMKPFDVHKQRNPMCPFVLEIIPPSINTSFNISNAAGTFSTSVTNEDALKESRANLPDNNKTSVSKALFEVDTLKDVRKRTFSHWPHRASPSAAQMIDAGFFCCNVGDRVICIYCNLICQQWVPNSDDDPCEIHKILSPKCPYVLSALTIAPSSSISIINEGSIGIESLSSQAIVPTAACNQHFIEIPKRSATFATWPNENLPDVDDLVRAGFFYTGVKTVVTCFYCNGSLQNWGVNDKPMIEHARWFPHCAYARQLCGTDLYRRIQESKKAAQEKAQCKDGNNSTTTTCANSTQGRLLIADESTLSRYVAARHDLPISQSLLKRGFKLSIIKRCWEDQLRLKHEDFATDSDLFMACTILKKQIECIDGKKENIIVPSVAMRKYREKLPTEHISHDQSTAGSTPINVSEKNNNVSAAAPSPSGGSATRQNRPTEKSSDDESKTNPCVLCLSEERAVACIPCGHLAACVPCGHSLRSCPICRHEINGFIRIYT